MAGYRRPQDQTIEEWWQDYERAAKQLYSTREENSMNINEVYPDTSSSLKAEDLKGSRVKVQIASVKVQEFENDGKKGNKLVLSFVGKEKTLVLNKTNANSIAKMFGPDTDNWIDGTIQIYPTTTTFGDKKDVPCIRVYEEPPQLMDDDIGF